MKKLMLSLAAIGITAPATLQFSNLTIINNHHYGQFPKYEQEFIDHKNKYEEYLKNTNNYNFDELYSFLSKTPTMIYKVYVREVYDEYMNSVYIGLNLLEIYAISKEQKNSLYVLKKAIDKNNLIWREDLPILEHIALYSKQYDKTVYNMQETYYAYNIGLSNLITEDINQFSQLKISYAKNKEEYTQKETLLSAHNDNIKQFEIAEHWNREITDIFDTILENIEPRVDKVTKDLLKATVDPAGYILENKIRVNFLEEKLLGWIWENSGKKEYKSYDELYQEYEKKLFKPTTQSDIDNWESQANVLFDRYDLAEMGWDYLLEKLIEKMIKHFAESAVPIIGQISMVASGVKFVLMIESFIFKNIHEEVQFLSYYILEVLPTMFDIIQEKYNDNPLIKIEQLEYKLSSTREYFNEVVDYFANVLLSVSPMGWVDDIINDIKGVNDLFYNWLNTLSFGLGQLQLPVQAIKDLRDEIATIPEDILENYENSQKEIQVLSKEIEELKKIIKKQEQELEKSKGDYYLSELNNFNSSLAPYNHILNLKELEKTRSSINPIKNLNNKMTLLEQEELKRSFLFGKLMNYSQEELARIDLNEIVNNHFDMQKIFLIIEGYVKEVV